MLLPSYLLYRSLSYVFYALITSSYLELHKFWRIKKDVHVYKIIFWQFLAVSDCLY